MQGKILIVEDDPSIRQLLRAVLEGAGHEVVEVSDGPSALPAAQECAPDCVLLDIGLPGIDGFAVLGLLKDDPSLKHVPVLMVTAWAEPVLVAKALDRGAHDYVRKPFDVTELGARVEAAIRVKREMDFLAGDSDRRPTSDSLTALPNRVHLDEVLERQVMAARRTGRPFSVVLVDVEGFEDLDPEAASEALRAAAKRLRHRARVSDVVGRWGDGRFLVVAPATDMDGARALGDDLCRALAERPLDTPVAAVRVTAACDVAEFDRDEHLDDLLGRLGAHQDLALA